MRDGQTLEQYVAHRVATARDRPLDADDVESVQQVIMDCLGVTVAGVGHPAPVLARTALIAESGTTATLMGLDRRAGPLDAALANATAAHALDFDDGHVPSSTHPSAVLVPALFALAEQRRASGRDVINAYVQGLEAMGLIGRLVNPWHYASGWHATATVGTLGAAVASASLLGLDELQIGAAIAIGASHAHGVRRNFGSMTKPLHAGTAARDGVMAALLAESGCTVGDDVLTGERGYLDLCGPDGWRDVPPPPEDVRSVGIEGLHIKQYPSCGVTHTPIEAALKIREEHGVEPATIDSVTCVVHRRAMQILLTRLPTSGDEGRFSLEHCVAVALVRGAVTLDDFTDERASDPQVRQLASRVKVEIDEALGEPTSWPATVIVRTSNGDELRAHVPKARGKWSGQRLSQAELDAKFHECLQVGGLGPEQSAEACTALHRLDGMADVGEVTRLLVPTHG